MGSFGLPPDLQVGSNTPGPHPASTSRPVHYPEWDAPSARGYRVSDHMASEPPPGRPFKIVIMGAGAAGIDFLHHAPRALKGLGVEIACYDKNPEVGGTWFENRYPGCACDVPSASYSFSWRPNPDWTSYYSGAREIWEYFRDIVEEEGLMRYIMLSTEVRNAVWDEERSKWVLSLLGAGDKGEKREWDEECDLFLNGTGFLNAWKWPSIAGLETFQGRIFHTARYEEGFDLKGKRVAVIGSGSSGVQTVSSIYPHVSKLYTWVRSPTWITAGFAQKFAGPGGANFDYSEEQKAEWRRDSEKYRQYRKMIENELNGRYRLVLRNSHESDEANAFAYNEMRTKLGNNPHLMDKMIPKNFNVACRRPTPGNGYLEALNGEKTTVFAEDIGSITPRGFTTMDGTEHEVDVIICATGFDTSYRPCFPIIGLDGTTLAKRWEKFPASYLGLGTSNFPNYLMFSGPFTPVAQGSVLPILTLLSHHFIQIVQKMRTQHIRRLSPKASSVADFVEHAQTYLRRTCWADPCTSWFKQGRKDGPIVMWPGSRLAFFELMRSPNFEDYDIEYWSGNRWGWLGNGFHTSEFDGVSDITFYLDGEMEALGKKGKGGMEEGGVQVTGLENAAYLPRGRCIKGMLAGNDNWRSPEGHFKGELNKPSDTFSFGAVCIYAVLGRVIFGPDDDFQKHQAKGALPALIRLQRQVSSFGDQEGLNELMKHVGDEEVNCEVLRMLWEERTEDSIPHKPFADWPNVSDAAFKDLIRGMMNLDPVKRVTARQALEHPWFKDSEIH